MKARYNGKCVLREECLLLWKQKPAGGGMLSRKASWKKVLSIAPGTQLLMVFGKEVGGEDTE